MKFSFGETMPNPFPKPLSNLTRLAPVPAHLEEPEANLFRAIIRDFKFDDDASIELLTQAMEAKMRARRCRESIDKIGEVWRDDKNNLRPHPLLAAERSARASYAGFMRLLRLDVGGKK
jgi:hypothetical protein